MMVTVAVPGVPTIAPEPAELVRATVNVLVSANGVALLMGTENVLELASPSAQFNVPLAAVKSVPAMAVPLPVA
jgi:hypothetical protein